MTKLLSIFIGVISISFFLFVSIVIFANVNAQKEATKPIISHTEQQNKLETYTYKITKIDSSGYYGDSTTDQTGIYFVNENIPKGTKIITGDIVEVSFPKDDFETITNIVKINP